MNEAYRDGDARRGRPAVRRAGRGPDSVTGVVVASAKKTFFAGGNLSLMIQAKPEDAPRLFAEVEGMKADLRRLEKLPRPVVAAINGAALGGGFEITLACQPPHPGRRPEGRGRPARGVARPAARRRRRHPGDPDARHPERADGRAAPGHPLQAGGRARARGSCTSWSRTPRRAGPGREGVDPRAPRRRRGRAEPVGPPGLQDARRHAEVARAGGVPAGFPGPAAPADQGRGLPRAARDPVRRGRGRDGRLRHRLADRVAVPHQPDRRAERQEHDPGVLLRPPGDQRRQVPARRASRRSAPPRSPCSAPG